MRNQKGPKQVLIRTRPFVANLILSTAVGSCNHFNFSLFFSIIYLLKIFYMPRSLAVRVWMWMDGLGVNERVPV